MLACHRTFLNTHSLCCCCCFAVVFNHFSFYFSRFCEIFSFLNSRFVVAAFIQLFLFSFHKLFFGFRWILRPDRFTQLVVIIQRSVIKSHARLLSACNRQQSIEQHSAPKKQNNSPERNQLVSFTCFLSPFYGLIITSPQNFREFNVCPR